MIANAEIAGWQLRGSVGKPVVALVACVALSVSQAADAQVAALASIYSDYRFRGVSLSNGRPVAILDLSYDLPNGLYAALSARLITTKDDGPQLLGYAANAGYAVRLRPGLSADFGVVQSAYSSYSGLGTGRSYAEVYAGITGKLIGARISISPNYLGSAQWTAYGEIDGHFDLGNRTTLEGSIGALSRLSGSYRENGRPLFDARVGIDHRLGQVTLHAALVTRGHSYLYSRRSHPRTALVVGISTAL